MLPDKEVKWHRKTLRDICQTPTDGLEYALLSKNYEQAHQLVLCKDLLLSAAYGSILNTETESYGFEYDPYENPPICTDKIMLMVCNWRDKQFAEKAQKCVLMLNQIERLLKMTPSVVRKVSNPPAFYRKAGVYIFEGDKRWINAPPMLSLYSLLIRLGLASEHNKSVIKTLVKFRTKQLKPYNWKPDEETTFGPSPVYNDCDLLDLIWNGLLRILKYGDQNIFYHHAPNNYYVDALQFATCYDIAYRVVDDCGMHGYTNYDAETYFKRWYKVERPTSISWRK